jgi:hypothetical protein
VLLKEEKPWFSPSAKSPEPFQHKQEKLEEISNSRLKIIAVFRIRINLIRIQIRIQHFRLNTDPDPIRIQGFTDQKLKKINSKKIFLFFFG